MAKSRARKAKKQTKTQQAPRNKSRPKSRPKVKAAAKTAAKPAAKPARAAKAAPKPAPKPSRASAAPRAARWVYPFGGGKAEGRADMRNLLGGKGAGLAEMANLGLPVPPGFTITTDVCTSYYAHGNTYPKGLREQVEKALVQVGRITGKTFGDEKNPLLVSVRSGAR